MDYDLIVPKDEEEKSQSIPTVPKIMIHFLKNNIASKIIF